MLPFARLAFCLLVLWLSGCAGPAPECIISSDCAANEQCVSGGCVAKPDENPPANHACGERVACEGPADCETEVCEDGCCAVTCEGHEQCRDDEWCRGGWCRPIGSPCVSNNDCSHNSSTPVCDADSGTCVGCLSEVDCALGESCKERGCHPPESTGCTSNSDCPIAELKYCLESRGVCVACLEDSDCRPVGTAVCDVRNHACRPLTQGCGWDGDCVGHIGGKRCRDDRTCVQCLKNEDCPRNRVCQSDNTCTTWPSCSEDGDCKGTTPHCRSSDSRCVECTTTSQCGAGKTCRDGLCLPSVNGCGEDSHCTGAKKICDTRNRVCVTCRNMDDCNGGFCQDDTCVPCEPNSLPPDCLMKAPHRPHCISGGCRECSVDTDCKGDRFCENMACEDNAVDTPCPLNGRCQRNQLCVPDARGTYFCRDSCDPLAATNDCPGGKACSLAYYQSGAWTGTCLPTTPGTARLNETCSAQKPCEADLECVPSGLNTSTCRRRCHPDRSPTGCSSPNVCQGAVRRDQRGVPQTIGLCLPGGSFGKACGSNAECSTGQICCAGPNPAQPFEWGSFCAWPVGTKAGGESCARDNECSSGLCLAGGPGGGGFCQGSCRVDADCPAIDDTPGTCGLAAVPWTDWNGKPITVDVVSCVRTCHEDNECAAGQICEVLPNSTANAWTSRCRPAPYPTGSRGGASCRSDSDCVSGTCITFSNESTAGICAGACNPVSPGTCSVGSTCPADGVLRPIPQPGGSAPKLHPAPICWPKTCTADAQCGHGRVCAPYPDPLDPDRTVLNCLPNQGPKDGGEPCTASSQCASNLCLGYAGGSRCFGACNSNDDCVTGTTCKEMIWKNTGQRLRSCQP